MNATRLSADPLARGTRDLTASRPVLSSSAGLSGGLLASLLRALLPFRSWDNKASSLQRAEPSLRAAPAGEMGDAGETRREPYLMGQRRAAPDAAD